MRVASIFDGSKVAVGDAQFTIWGGELQAVAHGKFAVDLAVSGDAVQPGRIVGDLPPVFGAHRNLVCFRVDGSYRCVAARLDSLLFASSRVMENVVGLNCTRRSKNRPRDAALAA